jgi:hypothetical protein
MATWILSLEILIIAVIVGWQHGSRSELGPLIRPAWIVPQQWAVLGAFTLCGSTGLFRRMRIGAVLTIGSEIVISRRPHESESEPAVEDEMML